MEVLMSRLFDISKIRNTETRMITAENVYGEKGKGGMAMVSDIPQEEVSKIGQPWAGPSENARELGQKWKVRPWTTIKENSTVTIMDMDGPATITHIWMATYVTLYRDLILRFYWDNETLPSVEVPFGDFFCNGWKMNMNIVSIPINTNPTGGMNCYFPMPFKKHAKVTVENRSAKALPLFAYAISLETGPSDESEGYFHAQFRRSNPLEYGKDHIILNNVRGEGHYAGTHMCWQQNTEGWWGEGEMKAFIDGDKEFPTYCGTGTEDYFGGAWGFNGNYSAPFLGYMDLKAKDGRPTNNVGNRHNLYRFHILDPIRFKEDFKMTIQAIGWRSENRYHPLQDDISSVAYWYMTEPFTDFPILPGRDQLEVI
jgi:hypothetical protein